MTWITDSNKLSLENEAPVAVKLAAFGGAEFVKNSELHEPLKAI
jgi:hypothetical protein